MLYQLSYNGPLSGLTLSDVSQKWWTGKDSNLRTPQGRTDLQSVGFNRSPTCPKDTIRKRLSNGVHQHRPETAQMCQLLLKRDLPPDAGIARLKRKTPGTFFSENNISAPCRRNRLRQITGVAHEQERNKRSQSILFVIYSLLEPRPFGYFRLEKSIVIDRG